MIMSKVLTHVSLWISTGYETYQNIKFVHINKFVLIVNHRKRQKQSQSYSRGQSTLRFDNFVLKFVGKEHTDYLMSVISQFYSMEKIEKRRYIEKPA